MILEQPIDADATTIREVVSHAPTAPRVAAELRRVGLRLCYVQNITDDWLEVVVERLEERPRFGRVVELEAGGEIQAVVPLPRKLYREDPTRAAEDVAALSRVALSGPQARR